MSRRKPRREHAPRGNAAAREGALPHQRIACVDARGSSSRRTAIGRLRAVRDLQDRVADGRRERPSAAPWSASDADRRPASTRRRSRSCYLQAIGLLQRYDRRKAWRMRARSPSRRLHGRVPTRPSSRPLSAVPSLAMFDFTKDPAVGRSGHRGQRTRRTKRSIPALPEVDVTLGETLLLTGARARRSASLPTRARGRAERGRRVSRTRESRRDRGR